MKKSDLVQLILKAKGVVSIDHYEELDNMKAQELQADLTTTVERLVHKLGVYQTNKEDPTNIRDQWFMEVKALKDLLGVHYNEACSKGVEEIVRLRQELETTRQSWDEEVRDLKERVRKLDGELNNHADIVTRETTDLESGAPVQTQELSLVDRVWDFLELERGVHPMWAQLSVRDLSDGQYEVYSLWFERDVYRTQRDQCKDLFNRVKARVQKLGYRYQVAPDHLRIMRKIG